MLCVLTNRDVAANSVLEMMRLFLIDDDVRSGNEHLPVEYESLKTNGIPRVTNDPVP